LLPQVRRTMSERRHKSRREKDLTTRYHAGDLDEDHLETGQRFTKQTKGAEQNKIKQTALLRLAQGDAAADIDTLPIGQVSQVYSLYVEVEHETGVRLCVVRKTVTKLSETSIVVGDLVRFRDTGIVEEAGRPGAVIEQVLPRKTVLTRAGSFHAHRAQPIVANAEQMLIVVSLVQPMVKWGLVDRMLIAAQGGGLVPIICLNKIDLASQSDTSRKHFAAAQEALGQYQHLGIRTLQTAARDESGIREITGILKDKVTVLAGHSGVGKSTLISAVEPGLDIRIGPVSIMTEKGRHTTTSARRYRLQIGGYVIDTPGVKQFGLWGVTADNLIEYFPDVQDGTAPPWRMDSYQSIADSL
jgi:ribosome biogenesis GTPase / thiamine phosphate phosphatase